MNTRGPRITGAALVVALLCLFLMLPSDSAGQCGPGGAGCGGGCNVQTMCDGVGCAIPGNHNLRPGYCTQAEKDAGAYEVNALGYCGNNGSGGCVCYLPTYNFQITRNCYPAQ